MSNINRTSDTLEERVPNIIKELSKNQRELKTSLQPIGADTLNVKQYPETADVFKAGPFVIGAGATGGIGYSFTIPSADAKNTIWNFQATLYIDGTAYNDRYPLGSNMNSGKLKSFFSIWQDFVDTDPSIMIAFARILNTDSSSHTYYIELQAQFPNLVGVS